jgi:hypothetical protein
MPPILDAILGIVNKGLDFIPDPNKRAQIAADQATQIRALLAQSDQAQADVDKTEAASSSLFVAGWRPAVGWVCAAGVAWAFVFQPFADWILAATGHNIITPKLDSGTLMSLLLGMLGMGGLRTYEKTQGVED